MLPARAGAGESVSDIVALALDAERDLRLTESLELCLRAAQKTPEDPDALNLMGRLVAKAGDASHAVTLQALVLHLNPAHEQAARDLDGLLSARPSPEAAKAILAAARALEPDTDVHHRDPMSMRPFAGMDRVERLVRDAIERDPANADAHAMLGNVLSRRKEHIAAIVEYGLAIKLRPEFAAVHLALAGSFEALHAPERAAEHFVRGTAIQRVYAAATGPRVATRVLVLAVPAFGSKNTPLDFFINANRTALHVYYQIPNAPPPALPEYDVIFNAIDESESSDAEMRQAAAFIDSQKKPAINLPDRVISVRRNRLPQTLRGVGDCTVPLTMRVTRESLERLPAGAAEIDGVPFPALVRPIDTHCGSGLERIASAAELLEYLERYPERHFNVMPFVDYRNPDGYYRKYRIVVVDGVPYPYHLAISDAWMVHYVTSAMKDHAWMRAEEERFFADPKAVFPAWETAFTEMAAAIGLEYFAVDCTVLSDGKILVFECGGAMLVHCFDDLDLFAYKYRYVPRIFDAFDALLCRLLGNRIDRDRWN